MPSLEVYLGTNTVWCCCHVAKSTPVPIQLSSHSGQRVGREKACGQTREGQPATGSVSQEGFSHLPVRHHCNWQPLFANRHPKWCWPDSLGGVMFVPCCHGTSPLHDQRRVCNLTQVLTSVQLLLIPTPVKTHQSHTQPGALSTQGMEPVLEISAVPSQPTNLS